MKLRPKFNRPLLFDKFRSAIVRPRNNYYKFSAGLVLFEMRYRFAQCTAHNLFMYLG